MNPPNFSRMLFYKMEKLSNKGWSYHPRLIRVDEHSISYFSKIPKDYTGTIHTMIVTIAVERPRTRGSVRRLRKGQPSPRPAYPLRRSWASSRSPRRTRRSTRSSRRHQIWESRYYSRKSTSSMENTYRRDVISMRTRTMRARTKTTTRMGAPGRSPRARSRILLDLTSTLGT